MFKIIKRYAQENEGGNIKVRALVYADTVDDLTTAHNGVTLVMGTEAYIINTGARYMLNGSNEWKEMSAAAAAPENDGV